MKFFEEKNEMIVPLGVGIRLLFSRISRSIHSRWSFSFRIFRRSDTYDSHESITMTVAHLCVLHISINDFSQLVVTRNSAFSCCSENDLDHAYATSLLYMFSESFQADVQVLISHSACKSKILSASAYRYSALSWLYRSHWIFIHIYTQSTKIWIQILSNRLLSSINQSYALIIVLSISHSTPPTVHFSYWLRRLEVSRTGRG